MLRPTTTMEDEERKRQEEKQHFLDGVKKRREEKQHLQNLLGKLEEPGQIARAVHYEASLRNSPDDRDKAQAFARYVTTIANGLHARAEMQIYRMMGESSRYFVGGGLDLDTLKLFLSIVEFWAFLVMAGGLDSLLQHRDVQKVYKANGSAAEVFRAFLDVEKAKMRLVEWTLDAMNDVLGIVHQVVREVQRGNRKASSSKEPPAKKSRLESKSSSQIQREKAIMIDRGYHCMEDTVGFSRKHKSGSLPLFGAQPTPATHKRLHESSAMNSQSQPTVKPWKPSSQAASATLTAESGAKAILTRREDEGEILRNGYTTMMNDLKKNSEPPIAKPRSSPKWAPDARRSVDSVWEVSDDESDLTEQGKPQEKENAKAASTNQKSFQPKYQATVETDDESYYQDHGHRKRKTREKSTTEVNISSDQHSATKVSVAPSSKDQEPKTHDHSTAGNELINEAEDMPQPKMSEKPAPSNDPSSSTPSIHNCLKEGTPLQRFSAKFNKIETSLKVAEKTHSDALVSLKIAEVSATEAHKFLDGFDVKTREELNKILSLNPNAEGGWTFEALRTQASAFRDFGMDKRRQLLAVQVPIHEEEEARKKLEDAKVEYEKWVKKMQLVNAAIEAFEVD